jgi:hypothetical protein
MIMPPANVENVAGCGIGFNSKDKATSAAEFKTAICALLFQTDEQVEDICARIRLIYCKEDPETPLEGVKDRIKAGEKAYC